MYMKLYLMYLKDGCYEMECIAKINCNHIKNQSLKQPFRYQFWIMTHRKDVHKLKKNQNSGNRALWYSIINNSRLFL